MPPLRKVVFCGTPDFAVPILDAVSAYLGNRLTAVFSRPDSHQGRGQKLTASPVKLRATELGLPIYTPESKLEVKQIFGRIKPDLAIVVAYGIIFPRSVVESYYCVNIHGSLLPKYRGASPIQAAILNGDTETGITLIRMNNKMDQGPILKMAELPIHKSENAGSLHDRLAALSASEIVTWLSEYEAGNIGETPQNDNEATYCQKITKDDLILQPGTDAVTQFNRIRAFSPVPGATAIVENRRIKILEAELQNGLCVPTLVRPEGKSTIAYADYLGNYPEILL